MTQEKISEWMPTHSCEEEKKNSAVLQDLQMDFLCGTEPDRTNQLPSTFMKLVGRWGTTDGD